MKLAALQNNAQPKLVTVSGVIEKVTAVAGEKQHYNEKPRRGCGQKSAKEKPRLAEGDARRGISAVHMECLR
jgi:hypothetical protein